ncbi:MAG: HAMP domain-containing protein [Acidobacteria bacterium]|nr:HAMP domain-containing protein [Acidobacteriota bacterium]MBI3426068.1 HAMP domain-containing protein [Acidobacteriota bacterium]
MVDSVRTKLTLWYVGVLALVLLAFSTGVYALAARKLNARLDAGLRTTVEGTARLFVHEKEEGSTDEHAAASAFRKYYYPRQAVAVFDQAGRLVKEQPLGEIHATLPANPAALDRAGLQFFQQSEEHSGADDGLRMAVQRLPSGPSSAVFLVVGQSASEVVDDLELLGGILAAAAPLALLLVAAGGWFLARRALTPVVAMSEQARQISSENLAERLPVANARDELGQLAETFNEMLARLQSAFEQQRSFMADASHELRTPLSVIHTAAQVTLELPHRQEEEYRDALRLIDGHTTRLSRIVADMFTLARADAGRRPLQPTEFYLDELVGETVQAARLLAARKNIRVEWSEPGETRFRGDEDLLRQLLLNLLDNAIKFTPVDGAIRVYLTRQAAACEIAVSDTGAGIATEVQPQIFERFFRVDKARARADNGAGSGAGLGLSIARWIAEAHAGSLELRRSDQQGSTFAVRLPTPSSP